MYLFFSESSEVDNFLAFLSSPSWFLQFKVVIHYVTEWVTGQSIIQAKKIISMTMHSTCALLLIQVQWNLTFTSLLRPPYFVPVKRLYILLKSLTVQNFIKKLIYSATLKLVMFILPSSIFYALIQIQFSNIISAFRINKEDLEGQLWSRVTVTQFGEVMRFDPNPLIRALRHEYDRIFMHGLSMAVLFAFHCTEKKQTCTLTIR